MIYIDLDGVLANWTLATCKNLNIPPPSNAILTPYSFKNLADKDLSKNHKSESFWVDMPLYPWAHQVIRVVAEHDKHWRFLTRGSLEHESFIGKSKWISKHFPKYIDRLVVCRGPKSFACKPGDILIDDHPGNIVDWNRAGGFGFLWYEMTSDYQYAEVQLSQLTIFLREFSSNKH